MGINSKERRDYYYYMAKVRGYRARSAFKLLDIDSTFNIFNGSSKIIDLCAAPGSWSQVLAEKTKAKILAIDVQEISPIDGVIALKEDITSESCIIKSTEFFNNEKVDLVVCDGAPDVTGFHDLDDFLQADLLKASLSICLKLGREGSTFVGKCFRGEFTGYLLHHFLNFYESVEFVKPKSSRNASVECFIVCKGMKYSDVDPLKINMAVRPINFQIKSCGSGPDPDFTSEKENTNQPASKPPIDPPYQASIKMRRGEAPKEC